MNTPFPAILEAYAAHRRGLEIAFERKLTPPSIVCACAIGGTDITVTIVADGHSTYAALALTEPVPDARHAEIHRFFAGLNQTVQGLEWRLDAITGQAVLHTMPLGMRFRNHPAAATVEELINDVEFGLSIVTGNLPSLSGVASGQLDADTAHRHVHADIFRALGIPESFDGA